LGGSHAAKRTALRYFVAMPVFIDSHAHIYQPTFNGDIADTIRRSKETGLSKIILPNIDIESLDRVLKLSCAYPDICLPTVGLHPCDVKENYAEVLEEMKSWAYRPKRFPEKKIYAIGETGLDYYWDTTFKEEQKIALRMQVAWALELDLPIILHTRNSIQETIDIIKELHDGRLRGVFHCFSGTLEEAQQIISMENFYLGIGGTVTYKNSHLPDVLKEIPLEKIMLETDAPYLSPVPYRGKRNESSYIPIIAERLAEVKRVTLGEVAQLTTANAEALFRI
jgi:TatD DNase family protein